MSTHIGVVEVPGLVEPLTRAGFDVLTGDDWKSAARAVRDARKEVGAFPIIIGDVSRPAIQAWVDATLSRADAKILAVVDETVADRAGLNSSSALFCAVATPVTATLLLSWLEINPDVAFDGTLLSLTHFASKPAKPEIDPDLADLFDLDAADTSTAAALTPEPSEPAAGYDDFLPSDSLPAATHDSQNSVLPEPVSSGRPAPEPTAAPQQPSPQVAPVEPAPELVAQSPQAPLPEQVVPPTPEPVRSPTPEPMSSPLPEPVAATPAPQPDVTTQKSTHSIIEELFSSTPPVLPEATTAPTSSDVPPAASSPASNDLIAELFGDRAPEPAAPQQPSPPPAPVEPAPELVAEPVPELLPEPEPQPAPAAELFIPPVPLIVDGEIGPLPKDDRALAAEEEAEAERAETQEYDQATVIAPEVGHISPRQELPRYPESSTPVVFTMAAKGGVTKTTTALALAHRAAVVYGKRVTVIDMNRGQGSICQMLRMDTERRLTNEGLPTVYDMAITRRPEAAMILPERASHFRPPELPPVPFALMLAPTDLLNDPLLVDDGLYRTAIDYARTVSNLVIVDTQIIESTDVSGLVDNVMAPLVRERGAWAVGLFENNREAIANLKARLESDFSGAPTGRVLLVTSLIHDRAELGTGLLAGIDTKFQGLGQYLGATYYDAKFRDDLNNGLFDSSSPAVAEVTDKIVSRVLGETPRLDSAELAPKRSAKRRGLFRRRH